ncbi:MAG: hypothetical protein JNL81_00355 [Hyphomonadaceae bacterium]|nr:hypothetical protein [Hyphomonadaceae bacterium]
MAEVKWAAAKDIQDALNDMAKKFNRGQKRGSLISMKMTTQHRHLPRPVAYREDLLRDLACDCCGRQYGVFAIALHCPDCAAPNLLTHFKRETELIDLQLALSETARSDGNAELSHRLLGNAHEDVLTAFETYLKVAYSHLVYKSSGSRPKAQKNRFQNVGRAKAAFAEIGLDPFNALTDAELEALSENIEKRHVVGHNLGLIDDHFVNVMEEGEAGKTLEISSTEVAAFAIQCGQVVGRLDEALPVPV